MSSLPILNGSRYRLALAALCAAVSVFLAACSSGSSGGGDTTPPDTTPPSAPATLSATASSPTQIDLSWAAAIDNVGVAGYQVERCLGVSCNIFTPIATPTAASFNDTSLTVGTSYSYRARAVDAAGNPGPYSNIASAITPLSAPTGVTATPSNGQVTLSWTAVPGAASYNVYTSPTDPATVSGTKITVVPAGATLSSLTNGTPIFAMVTAVNATGESAPSKQVCGVPTAADTTGLTLYDPLCGSTLDGNKWQSNLFTRGVSNGAMELSTQISNMESRTIQGRIYPTTVNVNAGVQRVTTLKADLTVPAATASRTGNAEMRAHVQLSYQPPANRLNFPGGSLNAVFFQVGLVDAGSGLRAYRRVLHNDDASGTVRSTTGITLVDPTGFTPSANGTDADAAASYDTTYTISVSLDETTGVFAWSIAGGTFGAGVSGTANPAAYLAANADWLALGPKPLVTGFVAAFLRTHSTDTSALAGSDASLSARFQNVQVGFDNAAAALWDDFSSTGQNSGPTELRGLKWTHPGGAPGMGSMTMTAGSLAAHLQATSNSTNGISAFDALTFNTPAAINTLQADVTVSACSNSFADPGKSNRVQLQGNFYNDGTPGTTAPDANAPNSSVGEVRAALMLDCLTGLATFNIIRFTSALGATIVSNNLNNAVPVGAGAVIGGTHTLRLKWDPTTHFFTFQVDDGAAVVVDPTTTNPRISVAAPYAKPANSPLKQLAWGVLIPSAATATGATASMDFRVNNVFTAP